VPSIRSSVERRRRVEDEAVNVSSCEKSRRSWAKDCGKRVELWRGHIVGYLRRGEGGRRSEEREEAAESVRLSYSKKKPFTGAQTTVKRGKCKERGKEGQATSCQAAMVKGARVVPTVRGPTVCQGRRGIEEGSKGRD